MNLTFTTHDIAYLRDCYQDYLLPKKVARTHKEGQLRQDTYLIVTQAYRRIERYWRNNSTPPSHHTITVTREQWLSLQQAVQAKMDELTILSPNNDRLLRLYPQLLRTLSTHALAIYVEEADESEITT